MQHIKNFKNNPLITLLTTELNGLLDVTNVLSGSIDMGDSNHNRFIKLDIELFLNTVDLSSEINPALYIYVIKRTDGSNFEDGAAAITPAKAPDAVIPVRAANASQRVSTRLDIDTSEPIKILIRNVTGATLAATGNTLKYFVNTRTLG
jgi:hypothetical protein